MKVGIVGASIGGLSAANCLRQLGVKVTVYEKFDSEFSQRGGGVNADMSLLPQIRGSRESPASWNFYGDIW